MLGSKGGEYRQGFCFGGILDWVPFVLEDAKLALTRWPGAQDRGMWAAGFYSGAAQALLMGGEPEAFLDGYACGSLARGDSDRNRTRISEVRAAAARARWDREQPKQIIMDANAYAVADANACAIEMHKTDKQDKTRQDTTEQDRTRAKRVRASFSPGMFDELLSQEFAASSQFVDSWHSWVSDRHARRKAITEAGAKAQLAKLAREAVTPSAACAWIEHSIANGYQGIFAPKFTDRPRTSPAPQFNGFTQTNYTKGDGDAPLGF